MGTKPQNPRNPTGPAAATAQVTGRQAAAVALNALPFLESEAKERQSEAGKEFGRGIDSSVKELTKLSDTNSGRAAQQAADMFKTNRQYVADAKRLKEQAPELFEAVAAGGFGGF